MEIRIDYLVGTKIQVFLKDHLEDMAGTPLRRAYTHWASKDCSGPRSPSGAYGMAVS